MPTGARRRSVSRSRGEAPRARVAGIQRSRLLSAAIRAVDELGYSDTSVADITSRARVSRRTFYEQFPDREACLAAALEDALGVLTRELATAGLEGLEGRELATADLEGLEGRELATVGLGGLVWRERVRLGLWRILAFFDREPVLARVCVVQALRGGSRVLERREEVLAGLVGVVDEGRGESVRGGECSALTAEGLVGAAFGIVYARLLKGEQTPLTELLGELMGMIVLPYLGPAAARREQTLPAPAIAPVSAGGVRDGVGPVGVVDPLESVPMRLTYRTSRVLAGVAELGGHGSDPSNRQVGEYAEIADAGQVSKLLRRLEGLGLLANSGAGHSKGEPNAWRLTDKGELVAQSIRAHSRLESEAA